MDTLVIYDETGFIYVEQTGDFRTPQGLRNLVVKVPTGKRVKSITISETGDTVVYEDLPKSPMQLLQEQLDNVQSALDDVLMGGSN